MDYFAYVFISLLSASAAAVFTYKLSRRRAPAAPAAPAPAAEPRGPVSLFFCFSEAEVPALAGLLEDEDPADAALVLSRMPRPAAAALLAALPPSRRAAALAAMAKPRPADLYTLRAMRDELLRRMYPETGGEAETASFLAAMPYADRKAALEYMASHAPAVASALREDFIMEEDLMLMPDGEMRAFCAAASPHELGVLLPALPEPLAIRIRQQFSEQAALAAHKSASGAPALSREAAVAALVAMAETLRSRGLIRKPPVKGKPAEGGR